MIQRAVWLRPARHAPVRFAATVAGVALGVASVVATLSGSRAAVASLSEDTLAAVGGARLELRAAGGLDESLLASLAPFCARFQVAPVIEETARRPLSPELLRVLGLDLLVDVGLRLPALESDGPASVEDLLARRHVLLPAPFAERAGLAPGDELELIVRGRRVLLEVEAVFDPPRPASAWRQVVVVDVALAQQLFGRAGRYDRVELLPRLALDLPRERAALERHLPADVRVAEPEDRLRESARAVRALQFNLASLSGISVLVAMVLVATTLATTVQARRSQIALLRSLGASRGQLVRALLAEAGAIGLAGGLLGIAAGALAARTALRGVRGSIASIAPEAIAGEPRLAPAWALLGLLLGLAAALLAALLPLRELLATPPLQHLRGQELRGAMPAANETGRIGRRLAAVLLLAGVAVGISRLPPIGDRPVFALCASIVLLGIVPLIAEPGLALCTRPRLPSRLPGGWLALRVARAALSADAARVAWAAGATGIAIALSVSMTTMIGSFRRTVVDWSAEAMRADLSLRPLGGADGVSVGRLDPEVVRIASELFGADRVDPFHVSEGRVAGRAIRLAGAEFAVAARFSSLPFLEGGGAREVFVRALAEGGAVANEPLAKRFGLRVGDRVRVETAGGTIERPIAGVYASYSNPLGLLVLDRADFLALHPDEGAESVAVWLPAESDSQAQRERLLERLGSRFALEVLSARELRAEVLAIFERTFAVTASLELVALLVAVLAVALVLSARVDERRAELSIVRALGGSRAQLLGIVTAEAGALGLVGALCGGLVGLGLGWILVRVVNLQSFGWTLRFLPPWSQLGQTLLLVLPASLLAGAIPAWRAMRASPRAALSEDA